MYGKAQRQPETYIRICVMGKKDAGKLSEYTYAKPMWMPVPVYILDSMANSLRYILMYVRILGTQLLN